MAVSSQVLKERIAVQLSLRGSLSLLEDAIVFHASNVNHKSAVRLLVGDHDAVPMGASDVMLFYTVEGLLTSSGDHEIFILDRCTMEQARLHATMQRPLTFALVTAFEPGVNDQLASPIRVTQFEIRPVNAFINGRTSANIVTRPSEGYSSAKSVVEAVERGSATADVEGALTALSGWVAETLDIVNGTCIKEVKEGANVFAVVDAFLRRHTTLSIAADCVANASGPFVRLEELVPKGSVAAQQWSQRRAALVVRRDEALLEAQYMSLLSRIAMGLKLQNTAATQTMEGVDAKIRELHKAFLVIALGYPGHNVASSERFVHFTERRIVGQVSADVVAHSEKLLALHVVFLPQGDAFAPKKPQCTNEGVVGRFAVAAESLRLWKALWEHTVSVLENSFETRLTKHSQDVIVAVEYAANRCDDITAILARVERTTYGILTPEVVCLFKTLHKAANAFPFLDAAHSRNWATFTDAFNKTLALKYTDVIDVEYETVEEATDVPIYDPHGLATSRLNATRSDLNTTNDLSQLSPIRGTNVSVAATSSSGATALRVENEVLSSRVTILSSELGECRELIEELRLQLARTTDSLRASQQLNAFLLAEGKGSGAEIPAGGPVAAPSNPAPSKTRERLIARLAAEEHRDLEAAMGAIDEDSDIDVPL